MALVAGHQSVAEVKRGSADQQIGERNHQSLLPGFGINFRDDVPDLAGEGFRRDGRENLIQEADAFGCLLGRLGAMDTVLQFD